MKKLLSIIILIISIFISGCGDSLYFSDENKKQSLEQNFKEGTPEYYCQKAKQSVISGDYKESIKYAEEALKIDSNSFDAYNVRGLAYAGVEKYELSIKDFTKSIELNKNFAKAYNNRGLAYIELKKYDIALKDFSKASEIEPNEAGWYYNRGKCYYYLGENKKSDEDYKKAKSLEK